MIKLYRGIIDIFLFNSRQTDEMLTTHIRGDSTKDGGDFGAAGYWNFLLEIIMLLVSRSFYMIGLIIAVVLAVVFFPLQAVKQSILNLLDHRATTYQFIEPTEEPKHD